MNLKRIVMASLFIAIGFIFRMLTPPVLLGMKPDFLLSMMFVTILLFDDYKMTLLIGGIVGILTAVTTTFPGGQIANIVDKLITCQCVFLAFRLLNEKVNSQIKVLIVSFFGTILSGSAFLSVAGLLFGLPGGNTFTMLFMAVVIPAAIANVIITAIIYNAVILAIKRTPLYGKVFEKI
ncbi:putative tryptophan transport protein [Oxobacter pfennigii]|uniref:Putative tryptophan transport protein n=1 Tax=Oxobacter pfennigii TaxID=36849 RepID=A0A0P8WU87_9CLOT|nr:tryptophan transporter [Oxobacter pfennigii]KPU46279.1 putative tryptophan transport protein [Oxobacter pfennigii]